jgi:hypothetical protein
VTYSYPSSEAGTAAAATSNSDSSNSNWLKGGMCLTHYLHCSRLRCLLNFLIYSL